jgi:hypothetical protein
VALLFPHVGPGILFSWVTNAAGTALAAAILVSELWGGFKFRHVAPRPVEKNPEKI